MSISIPAKRRGESQFTSRTSQSKFQFNNTLKETS